MGLFGLGKNKKGSVKKKSDLDIVSKNEITGSLFYLKYNIKSLNINLVGNKNSFACKVAEIDDKKDVFYLTVLGRAAISKSDAVELKYDIAEIRYTLKTVAKKHDTEHDVCLEYPDAIRHFERRKTPRAVFRKNEIIDISLVTDLFSGYGGAAHLNNLGMGGFCCTINKIVKVSSGKNIPVNPLTFKPSTQLAIVKFRLPGFGDLELSGETIHINQVGYNIVCGGTFGKSVSGPEKNILEKFLDKRSYSPVPPDFLGFYKKFEDEKVRSKEEAYEKKEASAPSSEEARDYSKVSEEKVVREAVKEESISLAREDEEVYEKKEPVEDIEAAKTRAEAAESHSAVPPRDENILAVLFDSDEVSLTKRILSFNGFNNVTAVSDFAQALKLMTEKSFNLIILDYDLAGQVSAEQFIRTLKKHPTLRDLPISIFVDKLDASKQARIISLRVSRIALRPIKESDIVETLTKTLGIE
jgi:CheY-like chemotaxis protein